MAGSAPVALPVTRGLWYRVHPAHSLELDQGKARSRSTGPAGAASLIASVPRRRQCPRLPGGSHDLPPESFPAARRFSLRRPARPDTEVTCQPEDVHLTIGAVPVHSVLWASPVHMKTTENASAKMPRYAATSIGHCAGDAPGAGGRPDLVSAYASHASTKQTHKVVITAAKLIISQGLGGSLSGPPLCSSTAVMMQIVSAVAAEGSSG